MVSPAGDKSTGQVSGASTVSGRARVTCTQKHRKECESAHSSCHGRGIGGGHASSGNARVRVAAAFSELGGLFSLILAMCSAPISHCVLCKRCQEELGFESAMFSCGGRYPSQSSHMMTSLPVC